VNPQRIMELLQLVKLPEEGGYYREVYRSTARIPGCRVTGANRERVLATDIYYLITPDQFSGLHRVGGSDEIFSFYLGSPVEVIQITPEGKLEKTTLGQDLEAGQRPKVIVPRGNWQGARLAPGGEFALLGCVCAAGFEFEEFEGGSYASLSRAFPEHAEIIRWYTHR
jgi:predicted cupin superfamily sugar epimerase